MTIFCAKIIKSQQHFITISSSHYNNAVYIHDYRLVIIQPKAFHFDLPRDIGMNLKHELNFITVF